MDAGHAVELEHIVARVIVLMEYVKLSAVYAKIKINIV
jgi:hypothetical protein